MPIKLTESSGDVFRDLGFAEPQAEELRLRSEMMIRVQDIIRGLRLSQGAIASRLGVSQPRVSDLLRGHLHKFSMDTLAQMLSRLGARVDFDIDDFFVAAKPCAHSSVWTAVKQGTNRIHVEFREADRQDVVAAGNQHALAA